MPPVPVAVVDVARAEALARLAEAVRDETGVAVALYAPDGEAVAGPDAPPLAALAAEVARDGAERVETIPGGARGAWRVRRRGRTVLVAAATVEAESPRDARRLLAAVRAVAAARAALDEAEGQAGDVTDALAQSFEEISLLHDLHRRLRVTQPVPALLDGLCRDLAETIGSASVAAWLPAEEEGGEDVTVVVGPVAMEAATLPALARAALEEERHAVVLRNHVADDPHLAALAPELTRLIVAPVAVDEGRRGAVVAARRQGREFDSPDAKLVRSVAGSVAMFIENRRLYRDLQQLMLDLVRALVSSIDAKDPYTSGHSERVARIARLIADELGLDEEHAEHVYLAGLLHDIGKIGTPEAILRKRGRLEPEEREVINEHPATGARILEDIKPLAVIREAVLHHHERFSGGGYPEGVAGKGVSLIARVVGLADALDAMTSSRPYRPSLPLDVVRQEIEKNSGIQFDPDAVRALTALGLERVLAKAGRDAPHADEGSP